MKELTKEYLVGKQFTIRNRPKPQKVFTIEDHPVSDKVVITYIPSGHSLGHELYLVSSVILRINIGSWRLLRTNVKLSSYLLN